MASTQGRRTRRVSLSNGDAVQILGAPGRVVLRLKRSAPKDADPLTSSFEVAVELTPFEAVALAEELLSTVIGQAQEESLELSRNLPYKAPA